MPPPDLLQHPFAAAIASAQPAQCVPPHLPRPEEVKGRFGRPGAGKARPPWPRWSSNTGLGRYGLVVTRYGYRAVPAH